MDEHCRIGARRLDFAPLANGVLSCVGVSGPDSLRYRATDPMRVNGVANCFPPGVPGRAPERREMTGRVSRQLATLPPNCNWVLDWTRFQVVAKQKRTRCNETSAQFPNTSSLWNKAGKHRRIAPATCIGSHHLMKCRHMKSMRSCAPVSFLRCGNSNNFERFGSCVLHC